ncbi:transient receptor potential channel pyrexia-like isoform X2 [Plodia interpunctella]|uniref:transient receptor potential channel pyrexia-like isoform X2 n=1 Tax=Plodia interpunctella TaxID=58824 RepID=UPI002368EAA1|nr:transient receptor potential channel pyrexia-like isoform X2 [Plodia interpunctella]
MCTQGILSSLFPKDVEQGVPEEKESQEPLLGTIYESGRPPRKPPTNLPHFDTWTFNRHHPSNPNMDSTPSSAPSTVNNTPLTESADNLPKKWRRSDRRLRRLNTELLEAIETHDVEEVERLLKAGANPNATCRLDLVSACHIAALNVNETLALLLKFGAEKYRQDTLGRTPLHLAAWAGNAKQMAILLDFPEDVHDRVLNDGLSSDVEEDVRKLCEKTRTLANVRCDLGEVKAVLPSTWKDNIDHNCKDIKGCLPLLQAGWTPLHVASSCARLHCTRLLLAAGADPNICDVKGRTALDVVGSAIYFDQEVNSQYFTEVIQMLLEAGAQFNTMKVKGLNNVDSPLHTAIALENLDAVNELLNAGASNACLNAAGQTPLHVCIVKQFEECLQVLANYGNNDIDPLCASVDVKDRDGHTVLQAAVEAAWVPGVCVALEAGADVTLKANDGETPIHSAAALGNLDVLNEILSIAKQKDALNYQNEEGETALFKAVKHGHKDCVEAILNEGASLKITLPGDVNVLHVAAEAGYTEILKFLIEYDEEITYEMINALTAGDRRGFGPIHFAVSEDNIECVKLLLSKRADVRLRTTCSPHKSSTPLHVAAVKNLVEIAKVILNFDKTTIYEVNSMGWFPLHTASHHGSRDIITLLLREGADLSGYTDGPKKFKRTAMDMIVNNLSKPAEFMEDVFDSYISTNNLNLQEPNCEITIDYRILMPSVCEMEQMKVIEALLKTGNRYGQKRLLVHPLVESFLYLKWKALLPFFYTIIAVYAFFVMSLTVFVVSVFFYRDTRDVAPVWLNPSVWGYVMYGSICLILIQEMLYMNVKSSRYFLQLETWVKFGSLGLAMILPLAIFIVTAWSDDEWPRHVATLALLLSWLEMMFLLSRFPNWGYYVLMFGKVASNVVKILLTFAFLVIGFSLSFMIQFHSQMPFESPWAAMVKTVVMMTSEFDYEALFDEEHSANLATSLVIVRVIFLIFLILAAIVLMNLMVGVAVNDINDLEVLGNIRRLAKQVEFLSTLDTLVYNRVFKKLLPTKVNNSIKTKRNVRCVLTLNPGKPKWRHYKIMPSRIRDAIFEKAMRQKKQKDDEMGIQDFKCKIEEIYNAIVMDTEKRKEIEDRIREGPALNRTRHEDIMRHLNDIDDEMTEMKDKMTTYAESTKSPIDELNVKMDQMSLEIEAIKQFLSRLETKIGRL